MVTKMPVIQTIFIEYFKLNKYLLVAKRCIKGFDKKKMATSGIMKCG